jgi:alkaline phosphatase D
MFRSLTIALLLPAVVVAQTDQAPHTAHTRNALDPSLAPFYHGVASGDPLSDAVIIWTRLTLDDPQGTETVNWRMATDTLFANVVASGTTQTDASCDWTVKVDVTGLQSGTWYYYDFSHGTAHSLIGRTCTAPTDPTHLRFAVVSCSSYENGYFNTYSDLATRNDFDAVLHLGDYIYEYATDGFSSSIEGRTEQPENEILTLSDYRTRYSHYRLDDDLRAVHQQYPFVNIWDDHETANNSWNGGAENHTEGTEGAWTDRKAAGIQANEEWLPVRKPDPNDPERIYRKLPYGTLADLILLDTRLYAREEQGSGADETRSLLGYPQRHWLYDNLSTSTATWKVIGQQVMVAPLQVFGIVVNNDQWDGYPAERDSLFGHLATNNIDNAVVLTGDIHTAWANDLPLAGYDGATGANSAGVEFVTTSVTSPGLPLSFGLQIIQAANPHIKYANLSSHGFLMLDLTPERAQSDYYNLSDILTVDHTTAWEQGWYTLQGENHLVQATEAATGSGYPPLAPVPHTVGVEELQAAPLVVGVAPNPFVDRFMVQFGLAKADDVNFSLLDASGREVHKARLGTVQAGVQYLSVDGSTLAPGMYTVVLQGQWGRSSHRVIRSR